MVYNMDKYILLIVVSLQNWKMLPKYEILTLKVLKHNTILDIVKFNFFLDFCNQFGIIFVYVIITPTLQYKI